MALNKIILTVLIGASVNLSTSITAEAQVTPASTISAIDTNEAPIIRRVIKAQPSFKNIYHVKADQTPSGFQVPRFVSLKFGKVNGRTGPSRDHPIAWQYQRRSLPLLVVAETEMWRKVRDITGDESWVRKPALSGEKFVLTIEDTALRAKPKTDARMTAQSQADAVLKLEDCTDTNWCKVVANNGLKGWVPRHKIWGAEQLK
ncbi:MAG: SH3 domain-containing protein [Litorimonas sp.]